MSDEERDDPFESFDVPEDREGDPFERLGDVGPDGAETADDAEATDGPKATDAADEPTAGSADGLPEPPAESGADSPAGTDEPAFEEEFIDEGAPFVSGPGATADTAPTGSESAGSQDDPLGDDDPFAGMAGRDGDPFGGGESVFESVDVESVDADEVWESLDEEPSTPSVEGSRYVEVSKHRFCEQCEFFSAPPNAHCTHEEAEIIEFLDMETVRLLNCPIVAEQRELEDEE